MCFLLVRAADAEAAAAPLTRGGARGLRSYQVARQAQLDQGAGERLPDLVRRLEEALYRQASSNVRVWRARQGGPGSLAPALRPLSACCEARPGCKRVASLHRRSMRMRVRCARGSRRLRFRALHLPWMRLPPQTALTSSRRCCMCCSVLRALCSLPWPLRDTLMSKTIPAGFLRPRLCADQANLTG